MATCRRDREGRPPDAVADHAGLAHGEVVARLRDDRQVRDAAGAMFSTSPTMRRPSEASR